MVDSSGKRDGRELRSPSAEPGLEHGNDYMKYTGMTPEKLMEQMRPEAEKRIKTRLVLEKVVEVENVASFR